MSFVQFSLKRMVEKSDAGIAPQCLQDATGSGERAHTHIGVSRDTPGFNSVGRCSR
jgi:hypothetical protein